MYTLETTGAPITTLLGSIEPDEIASELKLVPSFKDYHPEDFVFLPSFDNDIYVFSRKELEYNEAAYKRLVLSGHWKNYAAGIVKGLLSFHEPDAPDYITLKNLASGASRKLHKVIVNGSFSFRETVKKIHDALDVEGAKIALLAGADLSEDEQYVFDPQQLDFTAEGIFYEHLPPELQERAVAIARWVPHHSRNDEMLRWDDESMDEKNEDHDDDMDYQSDGLDLELRIHPTGQLIDLTTAAWTGKKPQTRQ